VISKRIIFRPSRVIQNLFPDYTWRFSVDDNSIFLTFDDGPDPEITPFVLDLLKAYQWKATFFCVGANVEKHPQLFQRIIDEGHAIGNHTFHHEKGTNTSLEEYLTSIRQFDQLYQTNLFRPPYGRMTKAQRKEVVSLNKHIILWSWISWDFHKKITKESILKEAETIKPGDILLLHDNAKFKERIIALLPDLFDVLKKKELVSKGIFIR
jgi:peptidoglycan-N-acetylglucosamine deacetylase